MLLVNIFTVQATGEYIEEEITITWENKQIIETEFLYTNGKIFVNFTNLLSSPSSVNFTRPEYNPEIIGWSPEWPLNFILAPGESYSNTFTLNQVFDVANNMNYACHVLTEGSNATILWGYKIIRSGNKLLGNGLLPTLFSIVIIMFIIQQKKKQRNKIGN